MTTLVLDPSQQRAVDLVCSARVGIVTGGPGTGKSTCLRVALDRLDARGTSYALASPTGKAAKRLSEATHGRKATTIHRLLEWGRLGFGRDSGNPLAESVVIVDEASMIDTPLFAALMSAIHPLRTRLVLVGDANQLPPVGPGQPFRDLVAWAQLPMVKLEVLHRSALDSWIHVAAQDLLRGRMPDLARRDDFCFVEVNGAEWILPKVRRLMTEVFGTTADHAIQADAQLLIPQRPGLAGIDAANIMLQAALNPRLEADRVVKRGEGDNAWELRTGDRVIQTRNDYKLEVFNGEMGRIRAVEPAHVVVDFGDRVVQYDYDALGALQLSYALTIHRTQGSEFPWTVVVCHSTHSFILSRQLVYTAITRAKRGVVLVGDRKGLERAVKNRRAETRNTTLIDRLEATLEPVEPPP